MSYEPPPPGFYPATPAPRPRRRLPLVLAGAATLLVLGAGGWFGYDRFIKEDPGVAACKSLAAGDKTFDGKQADDKQMTEAEYRKLRAVFEQSRHDDIRDHGTKLMDVAWQVSKLGPEPGMEALAYVGPLTEHMTGLQSACADQGVIVAFPNAAASPSAPAGPKCTDVFRVGEKIPAGFDGECVKPDGNTSFTLSLECSDGRRLFAPQRSDGVEPGWGYSGGKYRAGDVEDPESNYYKVMDDCTS